MVGLYPGCVARNAVTPVRMVGVAKARWGDAAVLSACTGGGGGGFGPCFLPMVCSFRRAVWLFWAVCKTGVIHSILL